MLLAYGTLISLSWPPTTTVVEAIKAFNSSTLQITEECAQQLFSDFGLMFSGFWSFSTGKHVLWEHNYAGKVPKHYVLHSFQEWLVIHSKQPRWKCVDGSPVWVGSWAGRDWEFRPCLRKCLVCCIPCVNSQADSPSDQKIMIPRLFRWARLKPVFAWGT